MPLLMVRNDITKMQTDAIVNPANKRLFKGSGTSYAIYQAAGENQLQKACESIGHCEMGNAVITEGFALSAKYIIHAVGPEWIDGTHGEERILYQTYQSSLLLAETKKCETIAFPLLSSGNLGFPKNKAMKVAVSAISDFLMEHEMTVYLVVYDRDSVSVSEKLLGFVKAYIDDNYVDENEEIFPCNDAMYEAGTFVRERERRRLHHTQSMDICEPSGNVLSPYMPQMSSAKMSMPAQLPKENKRSLEQLVNHLDETFSQMLLRLIDERNLKDSTVYKKANVDRRHFSKIRNNVDYIPTKKTVIAFAVALELTLDEAIDLLGRAGYAFSKCSKFDVIICFFLENESYDVYEINEVLFKYGQPILGE